MSTINYTEVFDVSAVADATRKSQIESTLSQIGQTVEGQELFRRIRDGSGQLAVTNDETINRNGYDHNSKTINLSWDQLETTQVKFKDQGFDVASLNRTILHETVHAAEAPNNPDYDVLLTLDNAGLGDTPQAKILRKHIEIDTVEFTNHFMNKYYTEPFRISEFIDPTALKVNQPPKPIVFLPDFNLNPDYVPVQEGDDMLGILYDPNQQSWWDYIKSYFYDDTNGQSNNEKYQQNYVDKLDKNQNSDRDSKDPDRKNGLEEGKEDAENSASPLILDLNNNGVIDLVSKETAYAYFDLDGDAFAENTGWIDETSGDGFLVADWNSDGLINGISELFGSAQEQGFIELALLDSNSDGLIDAQDTEFSTLQIWVDTNGNGYSEESELFTLADYNIESISLTNSRVNETVEGNLITNEGSFAYTDGTTGNISDIWFDYDNWNSIYNDSYTLDLRTLFLPSMRGYGDVADLHIAMSLDNGTDGLLEKVEGLAELDLEGWLTKDFATLTSELDTIMYHWAGVENIDPNSRNYYPHEQYVDARKIHYIEKMTGDDFFFLAGWFKGPNPPAAAAADLEQTFFEDQMAVAARLFLQGAGADLFNPLDPNDPISYDLNADTLLNVGTLNQNNIDDLELLAQDVNVDALELWTNVMMMVTGVRGDFESLTTADKNTLDAAIQASDATLDLVTVNNYLNGYNPGQAVPSTNGDDTLFGGSGDDLISGGSGNDLIYGADGNDRLEGSFDDDTLYGEAGDDWLRDSFGSNEFYGGTGGDLLSGGTQRDIYYFNVGDGDDAIEEKNTSQSANVIDEIVFGAGISLSDLTFVRIDNEALGIGIDQAAGGGSISVMGHFQDSGNEAIELIRFDDGSTFDPNSLSYTLQGTDESEFLDGVENGAVEDDIIFGNGGNDRIWGHYGSDEIHGGDGDDTIYAAAESSGSEVRETLTHILNGDAGWDYITGAWGIDHITGGTGNDTLEGLRGEDHYYFDYGDGYDLIKDRGLANELDIIHFGTGITEAMLSYNISGDGYDLTIIIDGGAGGSITIDNQFDADGGPDTVEQAHLANGTVLSLQYQDYVWSGTDGDDILYGRRDITGGNDTIYGLAGNDKMYGQEGDDILDGREGDDELYGLDGDDVLIGGDGADIIRGGDDNDTSSGGAGDDDIRSGHGDDILFGGLGNDYLNGESGSDTINYSMSATSITVDRETRFVTGEGTDEFVSIENAIGSSHNDIFKGFDFIDYMDGGNGEDLLDYSYGTHFDHDITVDLVSGTSSGYLISDSFVNFEHVITGTGDDTLTGNAEDNKLISGAGNDILNGGDGDDIFEGNEGDDIIDGGNDQDRARYSEDYSDYTITDTNGVLTVTANIGTDGTDTLHNIELIDFIDGTYNVVQMTFSRSPVGKDDLFYGFQNTSVSGNVFWDNGNGYDYDPDQDQFNTVSYNGLTEQGGTMDLNSWGYFTYTPAVDFVGTDIFEYALVDEHGATGGATTTFIIQVGAGSNTPPVAQDDDFVIDQGESKTGLLWQDNGHGNDYDPDGDPRTYTVDSTSANGAVIVSDANGWFRYTPDNSFFGTDTFSYTIDDGRGGTDTATVTFTVNEGLPNNQAPIAQDDVFTTGQDQNMSGLFWYDNGNGSDYDPDGDTKIYTAQTFTTAAGNTVSQDGNGWFIFKPTLGFSGQDSFTYTLSDGLLTDTATVTINVTANPDILYGDATANTITGTSADNTIHGFESDDTLYGEDGFDVLIGGLGADTMTGGNGADTFTLGDDAVDVITDFSSLDGDALDISDLLTGYDAANDLITDFVEITDDGTHSTLKIDADGGADNFVTIATLSNVTGLTDEEALETNGNLIA